MDRIDPLPARSSTTPVQWAFVAVCGVTCVVLLLGGSAYTYRTMWPAGVTPGPSPVPTPSDPSMGTAEQFSEILVGDDAEADAAYLSEVFAAAARGVEQDGKDASPRLTTRKHIATLVNRLGHFATIGDMKGKYPEIPDTCGGLFSKHFSRDPGDLTSADRAKAVELLSALSAGAKR
jgi:hypothetical protein